MISPPPLQILVKKCRADAILPHKANPDDAGADCFIHAFLTIQDPIGKHLQEFSGATFVLQPHDRVLCPLGFATAIPEGYYAFVVPRSGLALWEGISLVNTPGTIDAGYRNEWAAIVVNQSDTPITLKKGEKICQFIIRKLEPYALTEVTELPTTTRNLGGFGSTGK